MISTIHTTKPGRCGRCGGRYITEQVIAGDPEVICLNCGRAPVQTLPSPPCPRCGGDLRVQSRFCQTVCYRCRRCGGLFTQHVPAAVAEAYRRAA